MNAERLRQPSPVLVAELFPELRRNMIELFNSLSEEEWSLRTSAPLWNVKDVALHLLGGDIGILSRQRDAFSPPGPSIGGWDELVKFINDLNQKWLQATRRLSVRILIDLLAHTGPQVEAYFASLDLFALGDSVSWAGPGAAPVWLDLAREYTERWHHQQQIRDATSRPGLYEERLFAPALDAFVRALPHTFRSTDAPEGTTVQLVIEGPGGNQWCLRKAAAWELLVGCDSGAAAKVTLASKDAWKIFTRGLRGEDARKCASIQGNAQLAQNVLEMVSVIA